MDGTEHRADYVVSAADGYSTVFEMLDGQYVDAEVRRRFDSYTPFPGLVWVAIGVNRTFADVPISVVGTLVRQQPPLRVGNREQEWLGLHIYNQDPTLAPKGKTLITTGLLADYAYWSDLYERPDEYEAAKYALAQEVIRRMDQWCPGLAGQVEMLDVATPATFHRYTLNWQGSFEGWLATPANWLERIQKTLPGLRNFHMAGQWVEIGGGLPSAAFSGRHVVQLLCQQDGKRFKAQRYSHDGGSTPNAETPG
jgi:phytoene dehydrogenase-like protein